MKKIAVTGGLACGKSSVCRFLEELGAYVISADAIVHKLLAHSDTMQQKVRDLLGPDVVIQGKLDRQQISKKVFTDPLLLARLEELLHPLVSAEIQRLYEEVQLNTHASAFVAEVPLLFEARMESDFDCVIAVVADEERSRQRYVGVDFLERSRRQLSPEEKAEKSDFVIINNGSLNELRTQTKLTFEKIRKLDELGN